MMAVAWPRIFWDSPATVIRMPRLPSVLRPAAEAVARQYLGKVTIADADGLAAMFAPDGYIDLPTGARIAGRKAILDFYRALFQRGDSSLRNTRFVADQRHCVVEFKVDGPSGRQAVVDCFALDEAGLITSLTVYTRTAAAT
jgi:hypothetical protein